MFINLKRILHNLTHSKIILDLDCDYSFWGFDICKGDFDL